MVVDSSAMVNLLLNKAPHAVAVGRHLRDHRGGLAAPHLLDVEVGQALRRVVLRGEIGADRLDRALAQMSEFPLRRFGHERLIARALEMRANITAYDGVFVALSEALGAPLLTCDARLARAGGHRADVLLA